MKNGESGFRERKPLLWAYIQRLKRCCKKNKNQMYIRSCRRHKLFHELLLGNRLMVQLKTVSINQHFEADWINCNQLNRTILKHIFYFIRTKTSCSELSWVFLVSRIIEQCPVTDRELLSFNVIVMPFLPFLLDNFCMLQGSFPHFIQRIQLQEAFFLSIKNIYIKFQSSSQSLMLKLNWQHSYFSIK